MKLNKLRLKDKALFNRFLTLSNHKLSTYAFENIYIWKGLFEIDWTIIDGSLCVFFKDKIGCFLYLPPQALKIRPEVIQETFRIIDSFNNNKHISRIENVEEQDVPFYRDLGYACRYKSSDCLCRRADLIELKGNKFKSKRACVNYFLKHYKFEYLKLSIRHKDACLNLYNIWMRQRKSGIKDPIYQGMLGDSLACLKVLWDNYRDLDVTGRFVKIDNEIKGFTLGFRLNPDTFCILYEVTDLSIKGLAQFIFHAFCSELKDYKYINIMDDSGLDNLRKVKLSYHPESLIPAYMITRKNE